MKKIIALLLTLTLIMTSVSVFAADADYVGGKLIGKDVEVEVGATTVDVEIEFTTAGVTTFDSLYFGAVPDEGLTMKSITIPEEYAQYEDLANDCIVGLNMIWIHQDMYETNYAAAPSATFVITYEIEEPTVAKTYNITITDPTAEFDFGDVRGLTEFRNAVVTVKGGEVEPPVLSNDATLADLTIGGETIDGFAADVFEYTVEVANDVEVVEIAAIVNDEAAEAVIAGGDVLVVGENVFTITVTAEDGTVLVYTITVVKADKEEELPPAPEKGGALIGKDAIAGTNSTTVDVEIEFTTAGVSSLDGILFKAVPDEGLVLESVVLPAEYTKYDDLCDDTTLSKNIIWIRNNEYAYEYEAAPTATFVLTYSITDPTVEKTYNIDICEEVAEFDAGGCDTIEVVSDATVTVKSSDATLSALTVDGAAVEGFAADVYAYEVVVPNDTTSVVVDATATNEEAVATVTGVDELVVGDNEFTVDVLAADGKTTLTYTVNVIREGSDDATLKNIKLFGTTIEGFASDVLQYEKYIKNGLKSIELTAEANHENAQVAIEGTEGLAIGDNLVTITVTAEDGETQLTYNINVYRFEAETLVGKADIDEAQYKAYTVEEVEGIVTVTMDALSKHENADGVKGYWTGFGVTAPDGAAYVKTATGTTADLTLGELTPVTAGEVVSFIVDAKAEEINKYVLVQWFDVDGDPISYEAAYEMDITNITFADIILENGVNADISTVVADESMGENVGTVYTVAITDEAITDKIPALFISDEACGTVLKSTETGKFIVVAPKNIEGEVVIKAVDAEESILEFMYGDANADGKFNANDVNVLVRRIKEVKDSLNTVAKLVATDVNANGKIDANDINAMVRAIKGIKQLPALGK